MRTRSRSPRRSAGSRKTAEAPASSSFPAIRRLGTYRYLDMHMAIASALTLVDNALALRLAARCSTVVAAAR